MIMRENVPSSLSPRLLVVIGLLGFIALPGWTLGQSESKDGKTAIAEREKRLHELEAKLREVLKDLEAQRKPAPSATPQFQMGTTIERQFEAVNLPVNTNFPRFVYPANDLIWIERNFAVDLDNDGKRDILIANTRPAKPVEIALTRVIYQLPAAKAEALGRFLQQHIKADVMETKIEGGTLTVTTTPEVQRSIRQFIALMEQSPPSPRK